MEKCASDTQVAACIPSRNTKSIKKGPEVFRLLDFWFLAFDPRSMPTITNIISRGLPHPHLAQWHDHLSINIAKYKTNIVPQNRS